jgi:3-hydroxyacyl-CoA dehydrogenase / enoyl-CoA hydratase / 3-hydroxybutyryl-CoA epimerase
MSNATAIKLEKLSSGIGLLSIVTDGKPTVLSSAVLADLQATLDTVTNNAAQYRGLIVTAGNIAGANLEEVLVLREKPGALYAATQSGKAIFGKIKALPIPTVAVIDGVCLGGGLELALHCKYRIATSDAKTKMGLPEVGLGFLPGWGGTNLLAHMLGAEAAMKFINDPTRSHGANQAWQLGIVDEVVRKPEEALALAEKLVLGGSPKRASQSLVSRVTRWALDSNPIGRSIFIGKAQATLKKATRGGEIPAPGAVLKVITAALTQPAEKALDLESRYFEELARSQTSKALVGLYFAMQQSKKPWLSAKPIFNIGSVGVAGAGAMGAEIAYVSLLAGYPVILYDNRQAGLDNGVKKIHELFEAELRRGKMSGNTIDNYLTSLSTTTDVAGFKNCDLVIEAIKEDMGLKKGLLAEIEKVKDGKPFIFATNTSSLSVSKMLKGSAHPELGCGLHFFNPASKMPLIEIVAGFDSEGTDTSPSTIASVQEYCQRLPGKFTVQSADWPLFIVNRDLIPYAREAVNLLEMGVPAIDIEDAMKAFGMKMGPFALMDEVGLDICGKVMHSALEAYGDRFSAPKILKFIEDNNLLGKKNKKGIYLWDENERRTGFNPDVIAALGITNVVKMDRRMIQERLTLVLINEAARIVEDSIAHVWAVDLAMIMGTGFPPDRGGVLRYADSLGIATVVQKLRWLSKVAGENFTPCKLLVSMAQKGETFYK